MHLYIIPTEPAYRNRRLFHVMRQPGDYAEQVSGAGHKPAEERFSRGLAVCVERSRIPASSYLHYLLFRDQIPIYGFDNFANPIVFEVPHILYTLSALLLHRSLGIVAQVKQGVNTGLSRGEDAELLSKD
jgi:hypothetical protein